MLRRGARDAAASEASDVLGRAADRLDHLLRRLPYETDLEILRGIEGEAGRLYWAAFRRCWPAVIRRLRSPGAVGARRSIR